MINTCPLVSAVETKQKSDQTWKLEWIISWSSKQITFGGEFPSIYWIELKYFDCSHDIGCTLLIQVKSWQFTVCVEHGQFTFCGNRSVVNVSQSIDEIHLFQETNRNAIIPFRFCWHQLTINKSDELRSFSNFIKSNRELILMRSATVISIISTGFVKSISDLPEPKMSKEKTWKLLTMRSAIGWKEGDCEWPKALCTLLEYLMFIFR